jgi:hypothetical protein
LFAGAFVFTTPDSIFSSRGTESGRALSGTVLLDDVYALLPLMELEADALRR